MAKMVFTTERQLMVILSIAFCMDRSENIYLTACTASEMELALKNNQAKAVRFSTLEAICRELDCQPGDVLEYVKDE